jgi:hypothetical protein
MFLCTVSLKNMQHTKDVPDRRRFGHVNIACLYRNTVLAGRRGMGQRAMGEGVS